MAAVSSSHLALVAVRLPGLLHAMAHEGAGAAHALLELRASMGGRLEGEALWLPADGVDHAVELALAACGRTVGTLGVAAAIGFGEVWTAPDGTAFGVEPSRVRRMLAVARVGECWVSPAASDEATLPEGVGAFTAPEPAVQALGFEARVVRDYR